jgi:acid phosphatase family membrane protein YuiD
MDYSREADQSNAGGMMIGFEMSLFALAFVLAFIFMAIAEGRRREAGGSA